MASAGTGGQAGSTPAMGGAQGAAGSEPRTTPPDDLRNNLLDAVIAVLSGDSPQDPPRMPVENGASGLPPEFVKPILGSLFFSGACFGNAAACIAACVVIAQDCRPCMADEECRSALQLVCGDPRLVCPAP